MDNNPLNTNSDQPQQPNQDPQPLSPQPLTQPSVQPSVEHSPQQQDPIPQQPHNFNPQPQQQPTQVEPQNNQTDVLGIISLVMIFIFPLIGAIIGFVGMSKAKKEGRSNTLSKIGAIINSVLVALGILATVVFFALIATATPSLIEEIETQNNSFQSPAIENDSNSFTESQQILGRDTIGQSNVNSLYQKLEEFYNENGYYPEQLVIGDFEGIDTETFNTFVSESRYSYTPADCVESRCKAYKVAYTLEADESVYEKVSLN